MKYARVAALSLAALIAATGIVHAGIAARTHPAEVQIIEAAYQNFFKVYSNDIGPLIDASALPSATESCTSHAPIVFGVLVANVQSPVAGREFKGPSNDINLLTAALKARARGEVNIFQPTTRAALKEALLDVLQKVTCGDRGSFHVGGVSAPGAARLQGVRPDSGDTDPPGITEALAKIGSDDIIDPAVLETMRQLNGEKLAFTLDRGDDGRLGSFFPVDLNAFVSRVRNRGADIVLSLDSPFADGAAIGNAQAAAGDSTVWSVQSDGGGGDAPVTLLPRHGDFLALYATVGNAHSVDQNFHNPDGSRTVYGAFTFEYASALQDSAVLTARDLGESVSSIPPNRRANRAVFRIEGSNPNFALFDSAPDLADAANAIVVTSPEPTRGPSAVQSAAIDIAGVVNWPLPVSAVLINDEPADIDAQGRFSRQINLSTGLNAVRILALTTDSRLLQKTIDINFGGDINALKGNGKRYALIVGNQAYSAATGFAALSTPGADAEALTKVLTDRYGFETSATLPDGSTALFSLRDATGRDIQMALYNLSQVAGENDTVLIYYAGHGIYEPMTTTAFWVPIDAAAGVPPTYLSASTISEAIARIQARKLVLISDSCFSGALMRSGPADNEDIDQHARVNSLLALSRAKSRLLISSGNNEPVTDQGGNGHSIFAQALLDGLTDMQYGEFSARELFDNYILTTVTANSRQEPQFRPLENVGHEGGDVIFLRTQG